MSNKPPKIVIPGMNRGAGIPGGYILGRRRGSKQGPVELLNLAQVGGMGIATTTDVTTSTSQVQSIAHSETVSLSRGVSTSLSGAISSTSSLSSAVSTVISGSISAVNSRVDSLSTAVGGGGGVDDDSALSTSLSQVSSSLSGAISSTTSLSAAAGYLGVPQNIQNGTYTTVLTDSGKHIYHTSGSAHTWTIDSNANVAYTIGTILTFLNESGGGIVTLAITSDTLRWGSSTGSRSLAANATATAVKVASTAWRLTGDGIT